MQIITGNDEHKNLILEKYPHTKQVMFNDGYLVVAISQEEILGFAWGFVRDIPAPVNQKELFINVIEVFDANNYRKGIATEMIKNLISLAKGLDVYQVRAYCDINNIASNKLWVKNRFGISPTKDMDGNILGSYVTKIL